MDWINGLMDLVGQYAPQWLTAWLVWPVIIVAFGGAVARVAKELAIGSAVRWISSRRSTRLDRINTLLNAPELEDSVCQFLQRERARLLVIMFAGVDVGGHLAATLMSVSNDCPDVRWSDIRRAKRYLSHERSGDVVTRPVGWFTRLLGYAGFVVALVPLLFFLVSVLGVTAVFIVSILTLSFDVAQFSVYMLLAFMSLAGSRVYLSTFLEVRAVDRLRSQLELHAKRMTPVSTEQNTDHSASTNSNIPATTTSSRSIWN